MKNASSGGDRRRMLSSVGREMRGAFQRILGMEQVAIVSSRPSGTIRKVQLERDFVMLGDKRIFVEAGEAVDVFHHPRWTMEDLEEISKKLLGPTSDLMNGTVIFQDLLDGDAVAHPEELRAP